jgi:hypothetical protein
MTVDLPPASRSGNDKKLDDRIVTDGTLELWNFRAGQPGCGPLVAL